MHHRPRPFPLRAAPRQRCSKITINRGLNIYSLSEDIWRVTGHSSSDSCRLQALACSCVFLSEESLRFVDDLDQHIQPGVAQLRVAPADTDHRRAGGVQGEFHPREPLARIRPGSHSADHHIRVEARHRLIKLLEAGTNYLGVRPERTDTNRNHLPVGAVIVVQNHQYLYLDRSSSVQRM